MCLAVPPAPAAASTCLVGNEVLVEREDVRKIRKADAIIAGRERRTLWCCAMDYIVWTSIVWNLTSWTLEPTVVGSILGHPISNIAMEAPDH